MNRRHHGWSSRTEKHEVFIIGEQLRVQMTEHGQVRDRRYHLRKYRKCFIGRDAIDWLLKMYHVQSREEAVKAMGILQKFGLIHHVVDEHDFKDQHLFYRFTRDDDTYKMERDLTSFYRGVDLYRKLKTSGKTVMRDFYNKGSLYAEAFYGCELVDFLTVTEPTSDREIIIKELRDLLERDIIKHVTDDYHFTDDQIIYEFSLDFNKPCILHDVIQLVKPKPKGEVESSSGIVEMEDLTSQKDLRTSPLHIKSLSKVSVKPRDSFDSAVSSSPGSSAIDSERDSVSLTSQTLEPRSVLIRPATVQELEDPKAPYVKRRLQMDCDEMGFGFVLRGSSPCYVQTVDPLGPAAAAGLKVRQFISNVNGTDVLRKDHREVATLISQNMRLTMTVLIYRRESDRL